MFSNFVKKGKISFQNILQMASSVKKLLNSKILSFKFELNGSQVEIALIKII